MIFFVQRVMMLVYIIYPCTNIVWFRWSTYYTPVQIFFAASQLSLTSTMVTCIPVVNYLFTFPSLPRWCSVGGELRCKSVNDDRSGSVPLRLLFNWSGLHIRRTSHRRRRNKSFHCHHLPLAQSSVVLYSWLQTSQH